NAATLNSNSLCLRYSHSLILHTHYPELITLKPWPPLSVTRRHSPPRPCESSSPPRPPKLNPRRPSSFPIAHHCSGSHLRRSLAGFRRSLTHLRRSLVSTVTHLRRQPTVSSSPAGQPRRLLQPRHLLQPSQPRLNRVIFSSRPTPLQ
ncbi:hypothetical protein PIB30_091127, partial [Stylosanthes scabra]|nr:hypothetical protein [Stylosanthes scabra]